jgi:transposase
MSKEMQLKTILNRVESYKGFIFKNARIYKSYDKWKFSQESIVIDIAARKNSKPKCSICGVKGPGYDTLELRLFDYLPILGIVVYFAYTMRRVNCPMCGIKVESVPWAVGKSQLTITLAWYLADWAKMLSWKQVASRFRVSWDSVCRSVEMAVDWGLVRRDLEGITSIGVDEISRAKGHKYLTLVYQIDKGCRRLLWIGNDRTEKTFQGFFDWLGCDKTANLQAICSDMWKAYLKVIKERAPQALHVLDRFHIVSHMNKAIDTVRADENRRMIKEGYEPVLFKTRWLLLHRRQNLKEEQAISLKELLTYNLKTVRAYLLKEDFQQLWNYTSSTWAGKFIDSWCSGAMRSKIEPMKKIAKMIRNHRTLILNWFAAKGELSSGIVEGLNNKAKLTTRKSYGFKSPEMQKIALYHALGDLPVPEWTHRFC